MSFNAVALHPELSERILASYLAKILMDSFPLAAKATKPTHYFHFLHTLFRAIGVGGAASSYCATMSYRSYQECWRASTGNSYLRTGQLVT